MSRKKLLQPPSLRFSPYAWAKLLFLRDCSDNEVGGFGLSSSDDLLLVEDIEVVKQTVSCVTVAFDDAAVADFFDEQVARGRSLQQFARIWCHTHPCDLPEPSRTDEETFARVFGNCDWSVMFILGTAGSTYARLQLNNGIKGQIHLPVHVDYACCFAGADPDTWRKEYKTNVHCRQSGKGMVLENAIEDHFHKSSLAGEPFGSELDPEDLLDQVEQLDPISRESFIEELAGRCDLWQTEDEEDWL